MTKALPTDTPTNGPTDKASYRDAEASKKKTNEYMSPIEYIPFLTNIDYSQRRKAQSPATNCASSGKYEAMIYVS